MAHSVLFAVLLLLHLASSGFSAPLEITGRQRRELRSLAGRLEQSKELRRMHCVEPSVGATELREQLAAGGASAGLVRCKFPMVEKKVEVRPLADELAELADAQVVQIIGHTALFFRRTEHNRAFFDRHAA